MKRICVIWLCVLILSSAAFVLVDDNNVTEGIVVVQDGVGYVTHDPIRINSNSEFDEAHGVVNWATGDGSVGYPWIIEGWDINGTGYGYCLYIGNTTEYFEVRNCYLHNAIGGIDNWPFYYDSGLTLYNVANGTVLDNRAESSYYIGLFALYSESVTIINNTAKYNGWCGIYLNTVTNSIITNNSVSNLWRGIYIDYCENINISNNFVYSHIYYGIGLDNSNCSTLIGNLMLNDGIFVWGDELNHWNTHEINTSNTVNGKPVIYLRNQTGGTVPPGAGQVILANCTNVIINNQNVSEGDIGIKLGFSSNNTITNNTLHDNSFGGMIMYSSNENIIRNNSVNNSYMTGISIQLSNNNTVSNNSVTNVSRGIGIQYSNDNIILNNSISNNAYAMYTVFSDRTLIINNRLSNNLADIDIQLSTETNLSNNSIISGSERFDMGVPYGILFRYSNHSNVENNNLIKSSILIWGDELDYWNTHQIDTSNTVNGKPVRFVCNQTGGTIPPGAGQVILANCSNVLIYNQNLSESTVGLVMGFADNNIVSDNKVDSNGFAGIFLSESATNTNNHFYNNSFTNNRKAFYIDFPSNNNYIYHNNFINNTKLPTDFGSTSWDNGYPSGGNYWSDYTGVDFNSTPTQDVPPHDGIGDTSYWMDNYPLMRPFEYEFTNHNYSLSEGWNLVSIPAIQSNESLDRVLESIDGKWDCIQAYDPINGIWQSNITTRPESLNDLDRLNHKMGFWINITEPNVNLTVRGHIPTSTSINLYAGWNLIGYPSLNTETVANALWGTGADKVEVFDPAEPYRIREVGPSYVMKPGEGYWIHVPADTTWIVAW